MRDGLRGQRQIQAAAREAQKAAIRNASKIYWRRCSRWRLFFKLFEEAIELCFAVLWGDPQRILAEGGDVLWVVTMIMDHDMALELEGAANYHLGEE